VHLQLLPAVDEWSWPCCCQLRMFQQVTICVTASLSLHLGKGFTPVVQTRDNTCTAVCTTSLHVSLLPKPVPGSQTNSLHQLAFCGVPCSITAWASSLEDQCSHPTAFAINHQTSEGPGTTNVVILPCYGYYLNKRQHDYVTACVPDCMQCAQ
jgi:hypothetical protein